MFLQHMDENESPKGPEEGQRRGKSKEEAAAKTQRGETAKIRFKVAGSGPVENPWQDEHF